MRSLNRLATTANRASRRRHALRRCGASAVGRVRGAKYGTGGGGGSGRPAAARCAPPPASDPVGTEPYSSSSGSEAVVVRAAGRQQPVARGDLLPVSGHLRVVGGVDVSTPSRPCATSAAAVSSVMASYGCASTTTPPAPWTSAMRSAGGTAALGTYAGSAIPEVVLERLPDRGHVPGLDEGARDVRPPDGPARDAPSPRSQRTGTPSSASRATIAWPAPAVLAVRREVLPQRGVGRVEGVAQEVESRPSTSALSSTPGIRRSPLAGGELPPAGAPRPSRGR
jgi:hypothetical protein